MIRKIILTLQLTLPRATTGMLSAVLSSNFNRISIYEMGITAVIITTMLGLYHFLSPFQVIFGRLADRVPIFGLRRSPYILAGLTLSALVVAFLPPVALAMSAGHIWAFVLGFCMLILFGVGFCASGVTHLSLIADVVAEKERGLQVALTWIILITSMILTLRFLGILMPEYDYDRMREIYAWFVPVIFGVTLLGLLGVEKRLTAQDREEIARAAVSEDGKQERLLASLVGFVVDAFKKSETRYFFFFIFFAMFGIYLQDNILEVFGAEVMELTVGETGQFQQVWGAGALIGMLLMGIATRVFSVSKLFAIKTGLLGIVGSFILLAHAATVAELQLVMISLFTFGFFNGVFTVGCLSAMLDMTTEKDRGAYMGLWGLALAYAMGLGSLVGGALVSSTIETGILTASTGYAGIFLLEAALVLVGLYFVLKVNPEMFSTLNDEAMTAAMEADAA